MPKCPKCGAEIDSVNYIETGLLIYERGEWVKDEHPDLETTCPECGEKISLDEAIAPFWRNSGETQNSEYRRQRVRNDYAFGECHHPEFHEVSGA